MSKYNSLLKQIHVFEKMATYGSRKDFLMALAQEAEGLNYTPNPEEKNYSGYFGSAPGPVSSPAPANLPAPHPASHANRSNPTVVQAQEDLNALHFWGKTGPLSPDGILGPETQYALNQYRLKNKSRMPPNISNDLLYVMIHRDATGQNKIPSAPNLSGLKQTVPQGPTPHTASRRNYLKKSAQNLSGGTVSFPDESVAAILGSVSGSASNLNKLLESGQQANTYESEMAKKIADALYNSVTPSYVSNVGELNDKADKLRAWLGNAIDTANKVIDPKFKAPAEATEMADQLKQEAKRALTIINNFYRNQGAPVEDLEATLSAPQVAAPTKTTTRSIVDAADAAKNLAKSLEQRITNLPAQGPARTAQLKQIENIVQTLQKYFRHLQSKNDLPGYFARMEIVSALQKLYSSLEYEDLEMVPSLQSGHGVPEGPDSKI